MFGEKLTEMCSECLGKIEDVSVMGVLVVVSRELGVCDCLGRSRSA